MLRLRCPRGGEVILIVEDRDDVRAVAVAALRRLGYQVHVAASGPEALRRWEQIGGRCDLLLTDLVMPEGMSGQRLAAELQRRHPRLRVVFMSGYQAPHQGETTPLEAGWNFLPKPFLLDELAGIVRRRLDETSGP